MSLAEQDATPWGHGPSAVSHENLLREVNDRIRALSRNEQDLSGFLCECGGESCAEIVEVTSQEFDAARSHCDSFLVARAHAVGATKEVVETGERFAVVKRVRSSRRP
jgi:hypothetical protein